MADVHGHYVPRVGDTIHAGRKWMVEAIGSILLPGAEPRYVLATETWHGVRTIEVSRRALLAHFAARGAYCTRPGVPA